MFTSANSSVTRSTSEARYQAVPHRPRCRLIFITRRRNTCGKGSGFHCSQSRFLSFVEYVSILRDALDVNRGEWYDAVHVKMALDLDTRGCMHIACDSPGVAILETIHNYHLRKYSHGMMGCFPRFPRVTGLCRQTSGVRLTTGGPLESLVPHGCASADSLVPIGF